MGSSDTIIAPSRARRVALYIAPSTGTVIVNFGGAANATSGSAAGFQVRAASGTAASGAPFCVRYDDVGEALYQDVHAIATGTPNDVFVLDVFEADELGPDHYAEQLPQLWDARVPRAVAL